jgi:hypothetical protein
MGVTQRKETTETTGSSVVRTVIYAELLFGILFRWAYVCGMRHIFTLLLALCSQECLAQQHCISQQPFATSIPELTSDIERWLQHNPGAASQRQAIQIPTVVHIIWKNPSDNIADSLIHRTIELVNKDWRRQHADTVNTPAHFLSVAADMGIELVLASTDQDGNPSEGITRTYSDSVSFASWLENMKFDSTGGKTAWDTENYLNVWVIRHSPTEFGQGIVLGQSTMPGGNHLVAGVVFATDRFNNFGTNTTKRWRTVTHELGHYFCLLHNCGAGGCTDADLVDDTPDCSLDSLTFLPGCQEVFSCNVVIGDMVENHMAQPAYQCTNLFTQGQRERAIGCINANYPGLLTSPGLGIAQHEYTNIAIHPNPTSGTLRFEAMAASAFTITDLMGRTVTGGTALQGQNTTDLTALPDGIYLLRLRDGGTARVVKVGG